MNSYELTYLILPEIDEKELNSLNEEIKSLITKEGGILGKENPLIKKKLGYQIKKKSLAYLKTLDFQSEAKKIQEIKKGIESKKNILRFILLIKKLPKTKVPKRIISEVIVRKPVEKKGEIKKKVELKEIEKKLEEILEE